MWLIAGTVPDNDFGLSEASVWADSQVDGDKLVLPDGRVLSIARGTTALAATAIAACEALGTPLPRLLLAGDAGKGRGSHEAYTWLAANLEQIAQELAPLSGITFHYFYPDVDGHNRVLMAVEELRPKPILVADAGFMYVAKMSGYAASYDLFTPDMGEMAFLADETAPHPFYTRGFLLADESAAHALIRRALEHGNAPENMIVKGKTDYIVCNGEIFMSITEPSSPAMECIGGTGDIVTGLVTAWLASGAPICQSAIMAARTARLLARDRQPDPSTQAAELIRGIGNVIMTRSSGIIQGLNGNKGKND